MARPNTKNSPYFALTSSYVASLALLALLFIGANILLSRASEDQRRLALAAHLTDRQFILTQRIATLAERYAERGDPAAREGLRAAIAEVDGTAANLRLGRLEPGTTISPPPDILRIYSEQQISSHLRTFLTRAQALSAMEIAPGDSAVVEPLTKDLDAIVAEAEGPLRVALNAVSQRYMQLSAEGAERLETYQLIGLAVILLTLGAEALLIFRPLVSKVSTYVDEVLEHSRKASAARRAAQQASAAKTTFLSNMSHELRTPMTGIMGISDLLMSAPSSPEQAKMIRMLRQSAQILLDLLNDILDLAKIEAGRISMESIDFDLAALLTEVRNLFDPGMAEKGLAFSVHTELVSGDVFRGDPKHIRQILCNLVGNALKFTSHGSVEVRCWHEEVSESDVLLKFSVTDTGAGISEEGLTRLFRKFEQEETSTARRYGGTGLGLAICKQLSEAMGGGIDVESRKGLGSTFTFYVRVEPGDTGAVGAAATAVPARAGEQLASFHLTILLAEDNQTTQFIISRMLSTWGQTVVVAADGKSAVQQALDRKFDIILMDMQMPIMDGDKAARHIRTGGGPNAQTPIIALTADGILEHHPQYLAAGCNIVLTKPVNWAVLAEEIRVRVGMDAASRPAPSPVLMQAPASEGAGAILNPAMLDSLQEALSPEDFEEILHQFRAAIANQTALLARHIAADDLHQVTRVAHSLKGLCGQVGADSIAAIAARIEQAASMAGVQDLMPRLDEGIEQVCAALDEETALMLR